MRITNRGLLLSGALVAAAALAATTIQLASPDEVSGPADTAAAPAPVTLTAAQADAVFIPVSRYPEGTQLQQMPIQEALESGILSPPPEVIIEPAACTEILAGFVGDPSKLNGWVQRGTQPDGRLVDGMVGQVAGGGSIQGIRDKVAQCQTGTVTVETLGLTGTITLKEFEVPARTGVESIGVQQTVSFPDAPRELQEALETSGSVAQVYMTDGFNVVDDCEGQVYLAINHAFELWDNFVQVVS